MTEGVDKVWESGDNAIAMMNAQTAKLEAEEKEKLANHPSNRPTAEIARLQNAGIEPVVEEILLVETVEEFPSVEPEKKVDETEIPLDKVEETAQDTETKGE
jgi:hypothetical protein